MSRDVRNPSRRNLLKAFGVAGLAGALGPAASLQALAQGKKLVIGVIYVGPRDLSLSLGCALDPDDPVLRPALEHIWAACAAAGKPVGVHASDGATARLYRESGCRLITVAADAAAIGRGAGIELAAARDRTAS